MEGADARGLSALIVAATLAVMARPAGAQIAASLTATSNDLYRGVSLSDGKPALSLGLAYDAGAGPYIGGSLTGATTAFDGVKLVGQAAYLGYARRLKDGTVLDVGLTNIWVTNYDHYKYKYDIAELYAGARWGTMNVYLYYSPNYYRNRVNTLYAQVSGSARLGRAWRLFGRAGVLTSLGGGGYGVAREQCDAEAGVIADTAVAQLRLAASVRGPHVIDLADRPQRRAAIVLSATHYF